jgi:predicted peroxiredoxin
MMIKAFKAMIVAALVTVVPASVMASNHGDSNGDKAGQKGGVEEVLVVLSSDSLQTQGMAMVLSNTMAQQGAKVNVLLCDKAGDLALKSYEGTALKPKDVTPGQMLRGLLKQGGQAKVCALYLPNSEHGKDDLIDGVGVAMPPEMAGQMLDRKMRTFTF